MSPQGQGSQENLVKRRSIGEYLGRGGVVCLPF